MEENNEKQKKETKFNPLNIFFYSDHPSDFFSEIKEIIRSKNDKLLIKGEFDILSLLKELSYYLKNEGDKNGIKIKKIENQNLIISDSSFDNSKILLFEFIKKFKKGAVHNDNHPFFIFLKDEKDEVIKEFNIKQLIKKINEFQEKNKIKNTRKLDSRNISCETKDTILEKIKNIFNYFNENDEKNIDFNIISNYDKSYTINILTIGKRGSGKSTIINRLLGEKKAYDNQSAKTLNTKEYFHRYYPIKFIDSEGFEIWISNQIANVKNYLQKHNLNYENLYKKIHFIFYLFKGNDKFEDVEFDIIKELFNFNIYIIFILTNINDDIEASKKNLFKQRVNDYKDFVQEEKKKYWKIYIA